MSQNEVKKCISIGVMFMLHDLLIEYKTQEKIIKDRLKKIENKINKLSIRVPEYDLELNDLKRSRNNLNYYIRNLNYSIKWMELGHEPGVYHGIENRFKAGEVTE